MTPPTICIEQQGCDQKLYFQEFPLLLGRIDEADLRVADPWVSQRHCQLDLVEGTVLVRDLGSRNGTLVNGCRVSQSPLMPGDELLVGKTTFHIVYERCSLVPPPAVVYDSSVSFSGRDRGQDQTGRDQSTSPRRYVQ